MLCLQVYDYFEDDNYVYLVTELCPKGEMQGYLRKHGPLSEDEGSHRTSAFSLCNSSVQVACFDNFASNEFI